MISTVSHVILWDPCKSLSLGKQDQQTLNNLVSTDALQYRAMTTASESSVKPTLEEVSTPAQSSRPTLTPKYEFEGHEATVWSFGFLHDAEVEL